MTAWPIPAWLPPSTACAMSVVRAVEMTLRRSKVPGKIQAPGTLAAMIASGFAVLAIGATDAFVRNRPLPAGGYAAGLAAGLASFWIRAGAARALGRFWSMQVELRRDQPLVTSGPYGWVRHPIYLAACFEMAAVLILCASPWALAAALVLFVPALAWRLRVEERAMREHFGPAYQAYAAQVPALLPWPRPNGGARQ